MGYKVKIQKSKTFLHTNNEISEAEIRGKIPFTRNLTRKKVLRNKLDQGGKRPVLRKLKLQNTTERN